MDSIMPQGPFRDCFEWLEASHSVLSSEQFAFLIVLLWNIWNHRNRWIHSGQLIPARLVAEYAQLVHGDYEQVAENLGDSIPCAQEKKWRKPEPGVIKINVDGAWNVTTRMAAIGVIVRDHHGMMIDGCAKMMEGAHTAETVKGSELAQWWILLLLELPELTAEEAIGREESKLFILALAFEQEKIPFHPSVHTAPPPLLCSIGLKAPIPVQWLELILPLTLSYVIFNAIDSSEIHSSRALGLGSFNLGSCTFSLFQIFPGQFVGFCFDRSFLSLDQLGVRELLRKRLPLVR
ncbi:hypothetical protein V6N12_028968 [Hibiscus sabdariffa]|uniref:RNase H type-1 domain-containing protein n=1 Tax=Hibiscus sabdariffa TaxID=183260 RepID=A0ABR2F7E5_9ROSI